MPSLPKNLRKQLENAVKAGRRVAEGDPKKQDGAAYKALEALAVSHYEPWPSMSKQERDLRNRLRKHGRQLGDKLDPKGTQQVGHLAAEVAYEHWHRLLFARFLAENDLLIEPTSGVAVSIDEVRELAREQGVDWIDLAAGWAQRMLPQIFRSGDPVLEVALPPESRMNLEEIIESLPKEVFLADDSLGWVYQFWQAERKDEVNASGVKIGADELPAVTQLFTEDYMVDFLLDNTLGAWWAGKKLAERPEVTASAASEEELREAVSLPAVSWSYLRFVKSDDGRWAPAAGTFERWPKTARELTCLDPCMGSGHFIVGLFTRLVAVRMIEEQLDERRAIRAVIEQNLHGLEIDPRCTQIAAFNLAVSAWKRAGYCVLPTMNLACSGLGINAKEEDWVALTGKNTQAREAMRQLWRAFANAPVLGSLLDARVAAEADLFTAEFSEVRSLLESVLLNEERDEEMGELAVTARGVVAAAGVLNRRFTLVATNVPYLGRGKQDDTLREFVSKFYPDAKSDLATCFVERCLELCSPGSTTVLVTPQDWLYLPSYSRVRRQLLRKCRFEVVVKLGANAFQDMNFWAATTALFVLSASVPSGKDLTLTLDVGEWKDRDVKMNFLRSEPLTSDAFVRQSRQLENPDARILLVEATPHHLLGEYAVTPQGLKTGDDGRLRRNWWEIGWPNERWRFLQGAPNATTLVAGALYAVDYQHHGVDFARPQGRSVWSKHGIAVKLMGGVTVSRYFGSIFDSNVTALVPFSQTDVAALWMYAASPEFEQALKSIEQSLRTNNATVSKIPFDAVRWRRAAADKYPSGLPEPLSFDSTQWFFRGHPKDADRPLDVAVGRLLGYRWPPQTSIGVSDCVVVGDDGLERYADLDGIVCLTATKGEPAAADLLRTLLAEAYGPEWSYVRLNDLLEKVGYSGRSLEQWVRDGFFAQHCDLFHQRPFIWQIWDGLKDGFSALVNYHKLVAPNGVGRKTLEKLLYSYLGDWIERQRAEQKRGAEGADLRLAAAEHLAAEIGKILQGDPPYDIFVRWKPLQEQPIGWEPDINDGVRVNIRPFIMARPFNAKAKNACILRVTPNVTWGPKPDRGNEPMLPKDEFPWFWGWDMKSQDFGGGTAFDGKRWNDLHYTRAFKQEARARAKPQETARR